MASIAPRPRFTYSQTHKKSYTAYSFEGTGIDKAKLTVRDGYIGGMVRIKKEARGKGLNSEIFKTIQSVDKSMKGVKGNWVRSRDLGDNYDAFMKVYDPAKNNLKEAAFNTATGRIATKLGYNKVDVKMNANKTQITAYFHD
jgi:hypothetical protein